jgi:hypothetical protein
MKLPGVGISALNSIFYLREGAGDGSAIIARLRKIEDVGSGG